VSGGNILISLAIGEEGSMVMPHGPKPSKKKETLLGHKRNIKKYKGGGFYPKRKKGNLLSSKNRGQWGGEWERVGKVQKFLNLGGGGVKSSEEGGKKGGAKSGVRKSKGV